MSLVYDTYDKWKSPLILPPLNVTTDFNGVFGKVSSAVAPFLPGLVETSRQILIYLLDIELGISHLS